MTSKVSRIVLDAVVSFVFFIIAAIMLDWVGGIFGTRIGEHGNEVINVNGGVMVGVTSVLTIIFAVWFYKFLANHKFTKGQTIMNWPVFAFFFMFAFVATRKLIKHHAPKKPSYRPKEQSYSGTMTN